MRIQQASRLLAIPAATIRSWERRYGVPPCDRSRGGHRRYTPEQLQMLRQMRDDITRGHRAADAAASVREAQVKAWDPLIEHFVEAARHLDSAAMMHVLDSARIERGLGRTVDEILLPAMRQIGGWWETARCDAPSFGGSVASEHLATQTVRSWLSRSRQALSDIPRTQREILSCGPQDDHTLALESLAAVMGKDGWDCRILGARTPAPSLSIAIQQINPVAAVVVSHLSVARRSAVEALRLAQHSNACLFYAGGAFLSRQARRGVPGTYLGTNVSQAADLIAESCPTGWCDP